MLTLGGSGDLGNGMRSRFGSVFLIGSLKILGGILVLFTSFALHFAAALRGAPEAQNSSIFEEGLS